MLSTEDAKSQLFMLLQDAWECEEGIGDAKERLPACEKIAGDGTRRVGLAHGPGK